MAHSHVMQESIKLHPDKPQRGHRSLAHTAGQRSDNTKTNRTKVFASLAVGGGEVLEHGADHQEELGEAVEIVKYSRI